MQGKQIRVVIADDHVRLRAAVRKYLERASDIVVVGEAGNGQEAVDLVEALDPDLLILDLEMPVMGGIEALAALRQKERDVPVLILSATDIQRFAADLGASGYLLKGEALGLMISMVREFARRYRAKTFQQAR